MNDEYTPTEADLAEMDAHYAEMQAGYDREALADALYIEGLRDVKTGLALSMLTDLHGGDDCDGECPAPVEVLEVFAASNDSIRARVRCADGTVRVVNAAARYYPGNRECPPDYDVEYTYEA